ncbi:MAG TPA: hypothetical protein VIF81_06190 [Pyrinomonadaceae bacterium]|jgi:hypothetical protein
MNSKVAIGLRAKTGRAICVVLGGTIDAPLVVEKFEMALTDPKIAGTFQPYHEVMELPWADSQKAVQKFVRPIEKVARKALGNLARKLQAKGMRVAGVGIIGAKDRDLSRIGNYHIRAHAAEGVLFRQVLNLAAEANGLKWQIFPDKEFERIATEELGSKAPRIAHQINELGRTVERPWRAEEKQATTAAWLVLHRA